MKPSPRPWLRTGFVPIAITLALFVAGCGNESRPGRREGAGAPRRAFIPLAGEEPFFGGKILAEVHVGTEGMPEVRPGEGRGDRDRGGPGIGPQGGRSRVRFNGAMGLGGSVGGGRGPGGEGRPPGERGGGAMRAGGMGGGGRPVLIHLRFTNRGDAAVELRITDFVSPLGNFVVRPEKLTLPPGAAVEVEPMSSQLAGAFAETVATLVLRQGDQAERRSFPLKPAPAAPAPPEN